MSDPGTVAAQPTASTGWYNMVIHGITHGAATVYHKISAVEAAVTKWEVANAAVAPFINEGLIYATAFLTRMGIPVAAVEVIAEDILAALKAMAAQDASMSTATPLAPAPAIPTADPNATTS